jgi:hypothetical protein
LVRILIQPTKLPRGFTIRVGFNQSAKEKEETPAEFALSKVDAMIRQTLNG